MLRAITDEGSPADTSAAWESIWPLRASTFQCKAAIRQKPVSFSVEVMFAEVLLGTSVLGVVVRTLIDRTLETDGTASIDRRVPE